MEPLTVMDRALAVLKSSFGYPEFRSGQQAIIESVLTGRDTLAVLPTGGGKSLCYQIPALILPKLTVVISPLISLMQDQVDALARRGIGAAFLNSTLSHAEIAERIALARSGAVRILYVAPERFHQGTTAQRLCDAGVSLLAVDEAHCISEWGHDFRPSYLRIGAIREELGNPPAIALTATATPSVRRDIAKYLGLRNPLEVVTGFDRTNLSYAVTPVSDGRARHAALLALLRGENGVSIVYAATRRAVETTAAFLRMNGMAAEPYHAGLHERKRNRVQQHFMDGRIRIIVATNAFGMGIDKPDVRLVVHHSMPGTLEAYYQEAGRAGRDGRQSACVLLHAYADRNTHEYFIQTRIPPRESVLRLLRALATSADERGFVPTSWRMSLAAASSGLAGGEVSVCIDLLLRHGVISAVPASPAIVEVRIHATAARIRAELATRERGAPLRLLRAIHRIAGPALYSGAQVDLSTLPREFGGTHNARILLDELQSHQLLTVASTGSGFLILRGGSPDVCVETMDWARLERRRSSELAKLDSMQSYALTRSCRRAFVLRYFGDRGAASRCSSCDNCSVTIPGISNLTFQKKSRSRSIQRRFRL